MRFCPSSFLIYDLKFLIVLMPYLYFAIKIMLIYFLKPNSENTRYVEALLESFNLVCHVCIKFSLNHSESHENDTVTKIAFT